MQVFRGDSGVLDLARWLRTSMFGGLVVAVAFTALPSAAYPRRGKHAQIDLAPGNLQPECVPVACTPNAGSPSMSANGRFVAFDSYASNLVTGDTNQILDVFVRDTKKRRTYRASQASDGTQPIGAGNPRGITSVSFEPSISADGRFIAFASEASNLVPGDTNLRADAFVHDLRTGETFLASPGPDGAPSGISNSPEISSDGSHVVYDAVNDRLGVGPVITDVQPQNVYIFNVKERNIRRVSTTLTGDPCMGCYSASVSGDGRFVAFVTTDGRMVKGDTNGVEDVFVADMERGETERASVASDESQGMLAASTIRQAMGPIMSADGRFVAFTSLFANLVPSDTNYVHPFSYGSDVFVRDLHRGRTDRISVSSLGQETHEGGATTLEGVSGSGDVFVFGGSGRDLDPDVTSPGVYVHTPQTGATFGIRSEALEAGGSACYSTHSAAVSGDGRSLAFSSCVEREPYLSPVYNLYRFGLSPSPMSGIRPAPSLAEKDSFSSSGYAVVVDPSHDVSADLSIQGSDLIGLSIAYRSELGDLFVRQELDDLGARSPILHGLRFRANGENFEVRIQGVPDSADLVGGARFRLFKQDAATGEFRRTAQLTGGYGTTGEQVVFSLPLNQIGLEDGGELSHVEAFSALGTFYTGAQTILDTVRLR